MYSKIAKGVDEYMNKIIGLLNKSKKRLEKKNNKATESYVNNMREAYINDNLKVVFFKHFNEDAHPIGKKYKSPVNHYNVELHERIGGDRWEVLVNAHLIYDVKKNEWICLVTEKKKK